MVPSNLHYSLSMLRPNTHYFDVTLDVRLPESHGDKLHLVMPAWTPGHYVIEDFSRNVLDVKVSDAISGRELKVWKGSKNRWVAEVGSASEVRVEYSVYAFEHDDTKSYLDNLHALVNGAGVFIYPEGMEGEPLELTLVPFPGWKRASTGLERLSDWKFTAPSYDILVDSPIQVGNQEVRSFEVRGVEHEVSMFGSAPVDKEKFVADIRGIVEETIPVFDEVPYERYVFLVNFTDELTGGLEHLNSTVCMVSRFRLFPKEEYAITMGLFSHEFLHTWNVKRMRPKGLGPFNYSVETYTRSLWIAEGVTSYYDDYILRKSGLYSAAEYLDIFAVNINILKSLPGSRLQSAEEASFDSWIKFYKGGPNARNVTSSYYIQGAVIGWMLDAEIRRNSKGSATLDDAMRIVYQETYKREGRGYTDEEFEAACVRLGGGSVEEIFNSRVRGRAEIDYDKYLGYSGLMLGRKDREPKEKGFLGIRLAVEGGKTTVKERLAGSPAEGMGLAVGDEVVGVDGLRVGTEKFSFYIENRPPQEPVKLTVTRNGELMELVGPVSRRPPFEFRIFPAKDVSTDQKAFFRSWLLDEWTPEIKYPEYRPSPDRKPLFDFV